MRVVTLERIQTPRGELVLRDRDGVFEIVSNGTFLMDTSDGRSERLLVRASLEAVAGPATVLIGGLGIGFSLAEAVASVRVTSVTVVEIEPSVVAWHGSYLARFSGDAIGDPRVRVEVADVIDHISSSTSYDIICLDVDNGPDWTVTQSNRRLYDRQGLELLASRLRPGGALAIWSSHASDAFTARLASVVGRVETHTVDVPRGQPDVVFIATK